MNTQYSRRSFLRSTASIATLAAVPRSLFANAIPAKTNGPESLVKLLFESLKPSQRKEVCFKGHLDQCKEKCPRAHSSSKQPASAA